MSGPRRDEHERERSQEETRERGSTGAGAEAAEGIHGQSQGGRDERDRSAVSGARTGLSDADADAPSKGGVSAGSEPMAGRGSVHQSGYGGAGGQPQTSSDQREPENVAQTERDTRSASGRSSEAGRRGDRLGDEEAGDGLGEPMGTPDSAGARNIGAERDRGGRRGQSGGDDASEAESH